MKGFKTSLRKILRASALRYMLLHITSHLLMQNDRYKASGLSRSLWMGLAMFFVVFSCPVKKYIRMQLYKQFPPVESASHPQLGIPQGKECSTADRHNLALVIPKPPANTRSGGNDLAPILLPVFIVNVFLLIARKKGKEHVFYVQDTGDPGTVPLYLRLRHIQV